MEGDPVPMRILQNDPVAIGLRLAVHGGDLETVGRLLAEHPVDTRHQAVISWLREQGATQG